MWCRHQGLILVYGVLIRMKFRYCRFRGDRTYSAGNCLEEMVLEIGVWRNGLEKSSALVLAAEVMM